ncbi:MAG: hypothetical protein ACTHM5_02250 [Ginsengibacter sp.]
MQHSLLVDIPEKKSDKNNGDAQFVPTIILFATIAALEWPSLINISQKLFHGKPLHSSWKSQAL